MHTIARILFSAKVKTYVSRISRGSSSKALIRTVPFKIEKDGG